MEESNGIVFRKLFTNQNTLSNILIEQIMSVNIKLIFESVILNDPFDLYTWSLWSLHMIPLIFTHDLYLLSSNYHDINIILLFF